MKYEDIDCCDIEGNKFKVTKIVTGHMQKQRCRIMSCAYLDGLECSHVEIKSSKELCVKYVISCINNMQIPIPTTTPNQAPKQLTVSHIHPSIYII